MNWADRIFSWFGGQVSPKATSGTQSKPDSPSAPPTTAPAPPNGQSKWSRSDKTLHRRIWSKDEPADQEEDARRFTPTLLRAKGKSTLYSTDLAQLSRYGLPIWWSDDELAGALNISRSQLWYFSSHRQFERQPHYVTFRIPKAKGGERLIMAPKKQLKALQRRLLGLLVNRLPVSDHAPRLPGRAKHQNGGRTACGQAVGDQDGPPGFLPHRDGLSSSGPADGLWLQLLRGQYAGRDHDRSGTPAGGGGRGALPCARRPATLCTRSSD